MNIPDNIARVVVELNTGQWTSFTPADLKAVDEFTSFINFWKLLAFIAGLQEMPAVDAQEGTDAE